VKQNLPARIAAAASGVRASYLGWVLAALALLCVPCLGAEAQPPTPAGTKPGATAKPVRVALLTEEPSAAAALDLLTAELSKKDSLQLLERAEMERVYREQALAAGNKDYLKLGQVLGADGLLLFRPLKEGTNQYLQARLIAVKPGAIVAAVRSAWPVPDQVEWTKWLARYFEPSLPKLAVPAKDAVPLSVVNFRSALQSSDAQELERQFTLLTLERLSRQREVFVLERQRMELLTEEKELRGIPEDAFWNGSYLLEGILDREGYSKERVTLSARLIPPRGGKPVSLELSGSRTNLGDLCSELASRVIATLHLGGGVAAWNPADEAERYFEEAKWAYRWQALQEVTAACETSWALGKRSQDLAELRIRSYLRRGCDPASGAYSLVWRTVTFGGGEPPDFERLSLTVRAMELYRQDFRTFVKDAPSPGWEWHDLGIDLLASASYWLRHYYFTPEARQGHEPTLASVQSMAIEVAGLLGQHPAYTNRCEARCLLATKSNWGVYWVNTPEEGLELYRAILQAGSFPRIRGRFLELDNLQGGDMAAPLSYPTLSIEKTGDFIRGQMEIANPYLTGWKWQDRLRVPRVWQGFVDEVAASKQPLEQLEGLFLRAANSRTDEDYERDFRTLQDFIETHQQAIIAAGLDEGLIRDTRVLVETKWKAHYRPIPFKVREEIWKPFEKGLVAARQDSAHTARIEEGKRYLATAAVHDSARFEILFLKDLHFGFEYSEGEAKALIPLVRGYKEALTKGHAPAQGRGPAAAQQESQMFHAMFGISRLEQALNARLALAAASTNSNAAPAAAGPAASPRAGNTPPPAAHPGVGLNPPSAAPQTTNPLKAARFWELPYQALGCDAPWSVCIYSCSYREGRLWVEVHFNDPEGTSKGTPFDRGLFFAVDLDTLRTEAISPDPKLVVLPHRRLSYPMDRAFEVHKGDLYVSSQGAIKRYSLRTKAWDELPVPLQGHARISVIGDRLFFSTDDSILELAPDGKEVRLLASSRRRPAQTILDGLNGYGYPPLLKGPGESVVTFLQGKLYVHEPQAPDWKALPCPADLTDLRWSAFDPGMLLRSEPSYKDQRMFLLAQSSATFELLLVQPRQSGPSGIPGFSPLIRQQPAASAPRWPTPQNVRAINCPACLGANSLWIFNGPLAFETTSDNRAVWKARDGRHADLLELEPGRAQPFVAPLWFEVPQGPVEKQFLKAVRSFGPQGVTPVLLQHTPKGLVLTAGEIPGFWLIPQEELAARKKTWLQTLTPAGEGPGPAATRAIGLPPSHR